LISGKIVFRKREIKKRSPASFDLETPFLTSTVTIATIKEQNNILLTLLSNCLSAGLLHFWFYPEPFGSDYPSQFIEPSP